MNVLRIHPNPFNPSSGTHGQPRDVCSFRARDRRRQQVTSSRDPVNINSAVALRKVIQVPSSGQRDSNAHSVGEINLYSDATDTKSYRGLNTRYIYTHI